MKKTGIMTFEPAKVNSKRKKSVKSGYTSLKDDNKASNKIGKWYKEENNMKKTGKMTFESAKVNSKSKKSVKFGYTAVKYDNSASYNIGKWYKEIPDDPDEFSKLSDEEIKMMKGEAKKFLDAETLSYSSKNPKGGGQFDYSWMRTVMNKGTASDKIAAYTILVQDSPVYNIGTLRNLINLVKVGKKNECLMVVDTLTDLFLMDLLPPHRKLKVFESRPHSLLPDLSGGDKSKRQKYLLLWYFEDQLKELYLTFIQSLQTISHDSVDKNKEKAVTAFYKLLSGNPEQEKILLANIVNKLGDPSQKVVSKVIYSLTQLLHEHPNMKGVVTEEIEKLLFRPNVRQRAQYYGLCFLTQLLFTNDDTALAVALIKLYLSFFKACVKKGDVDSRLMSALFTGVNRAYPFARNEISSITEHIDTLYKVVHIASFNVSLHALYLLFHITDHAGTTSERYYSALYKKLLDPQIGCSSHQAMFLNLLFRSLQKDTNNARVRAIVKRLLQLSLYWPVPLVCGVQYMISQLLNQQMNIVSIELLKCVPKFENDESDDEEHYDDVQEEDLDSKVDLEKANSLQQKETKGTWFHCQNERENHKKASKYDAFHRNPSFSGGEHSVCTELHHLRNHYHPTVSLFAQKIIQGEKVIYSGDPLQDFSLSRFLERFVFKNPKKGTGNASTQVHKSNYTPVGIKSLAVTSDNYLNIEESKIPVDELFLYRYLNEKRKERSTKDEESDVESVASEEFEEMIDNMMGVKKDEIDFADEVDGKLQVSKKKGSDSDDGFETEDDQGSDIDLDEDLGSEDLDEDNDFDDAQDEDFEDMEDLEESGGEDGFGMLSDGAGDDDDEEELVFDDSDNDDIDISNIQEEIKRKTSSLKKPKNRAGKLKEKGFDENTFLPAEKFAEILEDTGTLDPAAGSLSAVSNKENADVKQLKWESRRAMSFQEQNKKWKRKSQGKQLGNFSKKRRK